MLVLMSGLSGFLDLAPRSDTLFGAVCWAIRWIDGEEALLDLLGRADAREPPFLVSSAFPFAESGARRTFLLPRPLLPAAAHDDDAMAVSKAVRRIRWVSAGLFADILAGRLPPGALAAGLAAKNLQEKDRAIGREDELLPHFHSLDVDRNGINRLTGAVSEGLLFTSRIEMVQDGGYFCLVQPRRPGVVSRVMAAFRFLADRGIGGDSSVGRGQFQVAFEDEDPFQAPSDGEDVITLSLFHPSNGDLRHLAAHRERVHCTVETRRGRLEQMYAPHARVWKPALRYLSEGSVFPRLDGREVYGCAPVVLDEPFGVRQNGFAYPVRMRHAVSL